jgi:hypothetical protein
MAVHPVWPSDSLQSVGIPEYLPLGQQGMDLTAVYVPPVNASTPPWRAAPHDSGPLWFATPSTYETFFHDTLPV